MSDTSVNRWFMINEGENYTPIPLTGKDWLYVECWLGGDQWVTHQVMYDPTWGKGRGGWFNTKGHAVALKTPIRWKYALMTLSAVLEEADRKGTLSFL